MTLPNEIGLLATILFYGVVAAMIILILRRPRSPRAMLTWILVLLFIPVLGLILFLLLGEPRREWHRTRRERKKRRMEMFASQRVDPRDQPIPPLPSELRDAHLAPLIHTAERVGAYPPCFGNRVTIYEDGDATFRDMFEAIDAAQSQIHIEVFILNSDKTGTEVRDHLIERARQGVTCRLLLDAVGCYHLSRSFLRPMRDAGIAIEYVLRLVPWRGRWRVSYRNHRKIMVVDGRVGFTGGRNIGDEYRSTVTRYGPWRDTHLRIVGPAVRYLQAVFVEDWHYTTDHNLITSECFPPLEPQGSHAVQIIPSGPYQTEHVLHQVLFAAISAARSSVRMITPYFVPDESMVLALQSAAYRGVTVQLIVPSTNNHVVALWAGRSFYEELCQAGVEIYEYSDEMLHSKVMIIDDLWATVGSANIDQRSFQINFELTTAIFDPDLARELAEIHESLRRRARQVTLQSIQQRSYGETLQLGLARLAAPLL